MNELDDQALLLLPSYCLLLAKHDHDHEHHHEQKHDHAHEHRHEQKHELLSFNAYAFASAQTCLYDQRTSTIFCTLLAEIC